MTKASTAAAAPKPIAPRPPVLARSKGCLGRNEFSSRSESCIGGPQASSGDAPAGAGGGSVRHCWRDCSLCAITCCIDCRA